MVGTSLIPFQFVDFVGARGTVMASVKSAIPIAKKTAKGLLRSFQRSSISTSQFKAYSYTELNKSLIAAGAVKSIADQGHHIIPLSVVLKSPVIKLAVKLGFDFNSAANGEFINIFTHMGQNFYNHPVYNTYSSVLVEGLNGLGGKELLKGLEGVLIELRDVVNTARNTGQSLDQVAKSRLVK
jgi:hypothetical protein